MASKPKKKAVVKKVTAKAAPKAKAKVAPKKGAPETKSKIAKKMLVADGRKTAAKKAPRKQEYAYDVMNSILPQITAFKLNASERVPASLKEAPATLQPKMLVNNRVFLTKDDSFEMMRSLIDVQLQSYKWFLTEGLAELLKEVSPITDFSGKKMELNFLGHTFDAPKYDPATFELDHIFFSAELCQVFAPEAVSSPRKRIARHSEPGRMFAVARKIADASRSDIAFGYNP
jgi:hypothetical protein